MTKSGPSRWTLPQVINPPDSVCFVVPVPNDIYHIAAFKGAIFELAKAYSWGNDAAHLAIPTAAVWRTIFDNLEHCPVAVQFRQNDICTLQASFDGGATWMTIYDASTCVTNGANQAIQAQIDNGTLATAQGAPGGATVPTQCYGYDVTVDGNGSWLCPIALEAGDSITVTRAAGGWWDGDITHFWSCPSGDNYILGACDAAVLHVPTDPLPTASRMLLIGHLPADATTPYFDMNNVSYTVPTGVAAGDFFLQANDSTLGDNQGSITLHVEVCKGGWVSFTDFKTGLHGWSVLSGSQVSGQGVVGQYVDASNQCECQVQIHVTSSKLSRIDWKYSRQTGSGVDNDDRAAITNAGAGVYYGPHYTSSGTDQTRSHSESFTAWTEVNIAQNLGSTPCGVNVIQSVTIYGTGTKPPELP